ncbi:ROK family protein [Rhodobium gokarnense]|uniref:Glucokinase n=1 Tax=Rhodobium gokarnense TaxID=364296 RepID=A0ABT3HF04_9HYPH|nr:ROK family protein [Rhodobium gokarnense]MCW2308978.1 glucokinase [Rhodobium gokarnense]
MSRSPVLIGLDVGGTNLKGVRVAPSGVVEDHLTIPAGGRIPRDKLFDVVATAVDTLSAGQTPVGVGLAFGGTVQTDGTMRADSTNLANLVDLPLADAFADLLGVPCRADHDGRAAMRGEAWTGAARGRRNAMIVTFGTGIGAGLLLDGRIYRGRHLACGELGLWRMTPPPATGAWRTLEDVAAPGRLAAQGGAAFSDRFERWQRGDAETGMDAVFEQVGRAIANVHLLLDLEMVVLFGAVVGLGEPFRRAVEEGFDAACPASFRGGVRIAFGDLGPLAGAIGAAALLREEVPA